MRRRSADKVCVNPRLIEFADVEQRYGNRAASGVALL
jgi:hypothetical protein